MQYWTKHPRFDQEIIVSNAVERGQTPEQYADRMKRFFEMSGRCLSAEGRVAVMYNSRSQVEWDDLASAALAGGLQFVGTFPMAYSAGSVVQDTRSGALKHDYVLVFTSSGSSKLSASLHSHLSTLPNWSNQMPHVRKRADGSGSSTYVHVGRAATDFEIDPFLK